MWVSNLHQFLTPDHCYWQMQKEEGPCPLGTPAAILSQQSNAARAIQHAWKRYTSLDYLDLLLNEMALSRIQSLETVPDARWPFNMLPSVGMGLAVPPQGAGWRVVRAECSSSSTSSCLQLSDKPLLGLHYFSLRDGVRLRSVSTWHGGLFTALLDATVGDVI